MRDMKQLGYDIGLEYTITICKDLTEMASLFPLSSDKMEFGKGFFEALKEFQEYMTTNFEKEV